jgi:hypothetical protein
MTAKDGQAMVVAALHHRSSPPVPAGQSAKPGRGNAGPPRHRIQPAARQRPQPDLRLEPRTVVHPVRPPAARRRGDPGRRRYDGFVRKVDPDRDLIVVDLVQVFTGDAAVRAAIADGMDRDAAQVRDTYVRNQNDRLRTLEMASKVQLHLIGACESTGQEELFSTLIRTPTMATSSTTPCGFRAAWCSASTSTRPTAC